MKTDSCAHSIPKVKRISSHILRDMCIILWSWAAIKRINSYDISSLKERKEGEGKWDCRAEFVDDWSQQFFDIYLSWCEYTHMWYEKYEGGERNVRFYRFSSSPSHYDSPWALTAWVNKWILGHESPSREMITSSCSIIKFTVENSVDNALFFLRCCDRRKSPMNFPCFES